MLFLNKIKKKCEIVLVIWSSLISIKIERRGVKVRWPIKFGMAMWPQTDVKITKQV